MSVNDLWINFKHVLSTIMEKHVPNKMISLNTNIPWYNQTNKRAARNKCTAYGKAKSTNDLGEWKDNKKLMCSLDRSLRKCRSEHLMAIGDNAMTSNSKPFCKFIKSLRQSSTCVLSLNTMNGTATGTIDNADALNNQIQFIFTKEDCSKLPTLNSSPTKSMLPIQIATEGIVKLLKELKLQKAPDGPDCITATISKTCAEHVAPLLQQIFQKSLDTGELPLDGRKQMSHPSSKQEIDQTLQITGQCR